MMDEEIIWKGYDRHTTMVLYHVISIILVVGIIYLSIKVDVKSLFLLIIPIGLSYSKYNMVLRNTFEINNKRIVLIKFEKGKYKTYEIQLYDVKHLVLEKKANGKGYIIFQTMSSKFTKLKSPYMVNPEEVHHIVRDIVEDLKFNRSKLLASDID